MTDGDRKKAAGEKEFSNLGSYTFQIICLPVSNADVDHVVSKDNQDRSPQLDERKLLLAVLYIKSFCCYEGDKMKKRGFPTFHPTENKSNSEQYFL